jgi:hypothetical protein
MAGITRRQTSSRPPAPRQPEQFRAGDSHVVDFEVSELVSEAVGSHSPFGDTQFPMPVEQLNYDHPTPENRPNLADGR